MIGPNDVTVFLDEEAFFVCVTRNSFSSYWRLNGVDYVNLTSDILDDLNITSIPSGSTVTLHLFIIAKAEHDGTIVQCVAESNNGGRAVSDPATLFIQGIIINQIIYLFCILLIRYTIISQ